MSNDKITVWYSIQNDGAGAAYPKWFLTSKEVIDDQNNMDEGWGEPCFGSVQTYNGSNIHIAALKNQKDEEDIQET